VTTVQLQADGGCRSAHGDQALEQRAEALVHDDSDAVDRPPRRRQRVRVVV
jgi:hypothetical protein